MVVALGRLQLSEFHRANEHQHQHGPQLHPQHLPEKIRGVISIIFDYGKL
jgi:hypothetical protein